MSMSTSIYGIKLPDERFKKMFQIYKNCRALGLNIPDEVDNYFDGEEPDSEGVVVGVDSIVKEFSRDGEEGVEIRVEDISKDVHLLRFVNSW